MTRSASIMSVFFAQALAFGGLFPRLPDIAARLQAGEAALGLALLGLGLGGVITLPLAPRVIARLGSHRTLRLSVPVLAVSQWAAAVSPTIPITGICLCLAGVSFALANIAMNVEANRIETADGVRIMNRCHGFWSVGVLVASLMGVAARAVAMPTGWHLALMVLPVVAILWAALAGVEQAPEPDSDRNTRGLSLPDRRSGLLVVFGMAGGFAQSATQNWSVLFLESDFAVRPWVATLTLPVFLFALTLGRMLSDNWVARFGAVTVARAQLSAALSGLVLVVLSESLPPIILGFFLLGIGTAALYPLMVSAAARGALRSAAESVSAVVFATSLTMLAAPPLLGFVAEDFGFRAAFALVALPLAIGLALAQKLAPADASDRVA